MTRLRHAIYSYLPLNDYRRLQQEGAARGVSLSKCVADCLREYLALKAEMAGVIESPGALGEPHQGVILTLLARTEERLAATMEAHTERTAWLDGRLNLIESMLDRLVMLVGELETPADEREP